MALIDRLGLTLTAGDVALHMAAGETGWAKVVLRERWNTHQLGAAMSQDLVRRLLTFMSKPPLELRWVLTLSESHSSVYGLRDQAGVLLRFQDRNAVFFADLRLDDSVRQAWIDQLEIALTTRVLMAFADECPCGITP
jgi:hypothetical protein